MTGRPKRDREGEDQKAEDVLKQWQEGFRGLGPGLPALNDEQAAELRARMGESEATVDELLDAIAGPDEDPVQTEIDNLGAALIEELMRQNFTSNFLGGLFPQRRLTQVDDGTDGPPATP